VKKVHRNVTHCEVN